MQAEADGIEPPHETFSPTGGLGRSLAGIGADRLRRMRAGSEGRGGGTGAGPVNGAGAGREVSGGYGGSGAGVFGTDEPSALFDGGWLSGCAGAVLGGRGAASGAGLCGGLGGSGA